MKNRHYNLLFQPLLIFGFTSVCILACKEVERKNGLNEMNLQSKVKSIHETEFDVIDKVGQLEKGKESFTNYFLFDDAGNKIEESKYWKKELREKQIFKYDDENQMIESRRVFGLSHSNIFDNKIGELNEVLVYKYYRDASGRITHRVIKPGSYESTRFGVYGDSSIFIYNGNGKLIEKRNYQSGRRYYGNGKEVIVDNVSAYLYNEDTNLAQLIMGSEVYEELPNADEERYLKSNTGKIRLAPGFFGAKLGKVIRFDTTSSHSYFYEDERLKKDVLTFANEASEVGAKFYVERTYNDNGDMTEEKTSTPDVKAKTITGFDPNMSTTYEYKYDQNKNWIMKVVYRNGIPRTIYERSYVYIE